jgi:CRP/FNR family transcriptional regulator, cyclic AMP receptor protein
VEERISHSLVKALRGVPDFEALGDHELLDIVGASANLCWAADEVVFDVGQESEALYVVLSGAVRIAEVDDGRDDTVAALGPGSSFGELSLLLHTTHSKRAVAEEETELLVVPKDSFEELIASHLDLAAHFQRKIEDRAPVRGDVPEAR